MDADVADEKNPFESATIRVNPPMKNYDRKKYSFKN